MTSVLLIFCCRFSFILSLSPSSRPPIFFPSNQMPIQLPFRHRSPDPLPFKSGLPFTLELKLPYRHPLEYCGSSPPLSRVKKFHFVPFLLSNFCLQGLVSFFQTPCPVKKYPSLEGSDTPRISSQQLPSKVPAHRLPRVIPLVFGLPFPVQAFQVFPRPRDLNSYYYFFPFPNS